MVFHFNFVGVSLLKHQTVNEKSIEAYPMWEMVADRLLFFSHIYSGSKRPHTIKHHYALQYLVMIHEFIYGVLFKQNLCSRQNTNSHGIGVEITYFCYEIPDYHFLTRSVGSRCTVTVRLVLLWNTCYCAIFFFRFLKLYICYVHTYINACSGGCCGFAGSLSQYLLVEFLRYHHECRQRVADSKRQEWHA